jgi:hypothetical protein
VSTANAEIVAFDRDLKRGAHEVNLLDVVGVTREYVNAVHKAKSALPSASSPSTVAPTPSGGSAPAAPIVPSSLPTMVSDAG